MSSRSIRSFRLVALPSVLASLALLAPACSSSSSDAPTDAGVDAKPAHKPTPSYTSDDDSGPVEEADSAPPPWDRMSPHLHQVLPTPHVHAVYIGTPGDMPVSFDVYLQWLLTSKDYWSILAQYGVGFGALDGSTQIDTAAFFTPGMVQGGLVDANTLEYRIQEVIHQPPPEDAGAPDATDDAAPDGGDPDGGDAGPPGIPQIPVADAYVFFLPRSVNVSLGNDGTTCVEAGGYHSYDGFEPYALIPLCDFGHTGMAVAHEMAEMATDPIPGRGWFSDADIANAGGEIGDLCNSPSNIGVREITELWSNADGECRP